MAWTIQRLIGGKMALHAYCDEPTCRHNQQIDLLKLRERLGPDAPAMAGDLTAMMRCSRCGSKKVTLIYAPDMDAMRDQRAREWGAPRVSNRSTAK